MTYTLRYRSSRAAVWRQYWRLWRAKLWRIHALLAGAVLLGFIARSSKTDLSIVAVEVGIAAFVGIVALSASFSQILFKGSERVLEVGPKGWSTTIGRKSGSRLWSETAPIEDRTETLVLLSKNGNSLLIPNCAFETSAQRASFVSQVKEWQTNAV